MDQSKEIGDLLDSYVPPADATSTETPVVEAVPETKPEEVEVKADGQEGEERAEEKAGGQEQAGESGSEGEKGEGEEVAAKSADQVKPAESAKPAETDLQKAQRELAEMRARLEEMADRAINPPAPPRPKLTPEQEAVRKADLEKRAKQAIKFLPDDNAFDEVMKSSDSFNTFLTSVLNFTTERILRMVPQVATQYVEQQLNYKTAAQEFYQANEDLIPHKKYVGFVSNELLAQHADWDLPKLLQETEKTVRERLKIQKAAGAASGARIENGNTRTVANNPGFVPGGSSGRRGEAQSSVSGQEKQILDLLS